MNFCVTRVSKSGFIILLLLLVLEIECKRKGGGGRRTGGGGGHTTPRSHNYHNTGTQSNEHQVHQTNTYQTNNNNPQVPSAPIAPPSSNTNLGFENVNHGSHGNRQDIGFENVHNRLPQQNNQPGGPPIGFNVPQQNHQFNVPQQNHPPSHSPGFNGPPNSGYPPQGGVQNTHYQPSNTYPGASNNNYNPQMNTGNYHPNFGQYGGNNAFNPHLSGGGYHNPNLAQPGSYYNPNYGVPGGVHPPIYQPPQSSGSSILGYAGAFAGGALIGNLLSGGHRNDYTVHHYHHNRDEIPKRTSVSNNSLATCSQNETQSLCVPNTFPICLANGTILCVTHLPYTVPCGQNQSMSCVVTVLPCANGTTCNTTADNSTTTAVYIPCISNVTLEKPTELQNMALPGSNTTTNGTVSNNKVELCITAIAEPKKMESPAVSYLSLIEKLLEFPFDVNIRSEMSFGDNQNMTVDKNNTIIVSS